MPPPSKRYSPPPRHEDQPILIKVSENFTELPEPKMNLVNAADSKYEKTRTLFSFHDLV